MSKERSIRSQMLMVVSCAQLARASVLFASLYLVCTSALAGVAVAFPLTQLVDESDLIVVGKVRGFNSYRTDFESFDAISEEYYTRRNMILTDFDIEVLQLLKGSLKNVDSIKLTVFGGEVDGRGFWCSICFELSEGSTILAFLKRNTANEKWLSAESALSIFEVTYSGNTRKLIPFENMEILVQPGHENLPRTGAVLNLESLDDVITEVNNRD